MSLKLKSGFEFDYDNLYGEGKVTDADLKSYEADLKRAHEAMKVMREKGFIRAHLSKDGEPEKVLFSQLPYVEEGHLNSPSSMKHLQELTDHVKDYVDVDSSRDKKKLHEVITERITRAPKASFVYSMKLD